MARLTGWIGIVGGAAWVSLAWFPTQCAPVTGASEVFCNRLWTLPLLAMFVASGSWLRAVWARIGRGARIGQGLTTIGYGLAALGNGGEYWLAYQLPHQGPDGWVRGVLWLAVLAGWLGVLVGSTVVGVAVLRTGFAPRWAGALLVLVIPITVVLGAAGYPALLLGIIGVVVGVLGLGTAAGDRFGRPTQTQVLA